MEIARLESLSPSQVDHLVEMFQAEWWTAGRSRADVQKMLRHSELVVALEERSSYELLAFSRVLTDYVYKAVIFDVVVVPYCRDLGLGKLVMDAIMSAPGLASVQHFELYCVPEMVPFYRKWGFSDELGGLRFMRARK